MPTNMVTKEEFSNLIRKQSKKAFKKKQSTAKLDARMVSATDEEWEKTNSELCEIIYGGERLLSYKDFTKMRQ